MVGEEPNFEMNDPEEKEGFPWLIILGVAAVTVILAFWLTRSKAQQDSTAAVIEQQRVGAKVVLDQEHEKVFELTRKLDALKQRITSGDVPNKQAAVAEYNKLAAEQRAQREKVKTLAEQYNQIVAKLHELQ